MAVQAPSVTQLQSLYGHTHQVQWSAALADTFTPYQNSVSADRSIHVFGTFGGATVTLVGSNEIPVGAAVPTTSLSALHDPQGNAISITSAKILELSELTNWIAPVLTGGDGTTALTIALCVRSVL